MESETGVQLMTIREAAQMLRLSERTLFAMTAPRGPVPVVRFGRAVRYSVASIRQWIDEQLNQGSAENVESTSQT